MKLFSKILFCLICVLGLSTSVNAASNRISAYQSSTKYEYISGLPVYYNKSGNYNLYVLDSNTYFTGSSYLYNPTEVDNGFAYIIRNSTVTNNSSKNYYIAQIAILWYKDYLNGNNVNISASMKETITSKTNDTVCYYITKLVNNAKNYSNNNNLINFIDDEITFTRNGNYYYSNIIDVLVNGLNTKPTVSLYNAPTSATIINNTVTNNGTGSFQIRIPANSITNVDEKDFIVNVTGTGYNYTYYEYTYNNSERVIYAYPYSSNYDNVEASMVAKISNTANTNVRLKFIDTLENYISGIKYNIYKGSCYSTSCNNNDLVYTFTTKNTYVELYNILESGTYTLERLTETNYKLPLKQSFIVEDTDSLQNIIFDENDYYNAENNLNTKVITIYNDLNDSTNVIKIYSQSDILITSYRSNNTSYDVTLSEGIYYIIDSKGELNKLYFMITENGTLKIKNNDEYVTINSIKLIKEDYEYIIDDNEENDEIYYEDEDGTIHIDNLDGVDSIDISQNVETKTDVKIEWLNNIIDCPITSLSSTVKYIIGAIILGTGIFMVVRNVKKQKNNI